MAGADDIKNIGKRYAFNRIPISKVIFVKHRDQIIATALGIVIFHRFLKIIWQYFKIIKEKYIRLRPDVGHIDLRKFRVSLNVIHDLSHPVLPIYSISVSILTII